MKKIGEQLASDRIKTNKSLQKDFFKAMEDKKFQILVSKLKLDDEILMKYTSSLEESAEEYNNCMGCKSILECQNKIEGYAYIPKINNNKLQFNYTPCKFKKELAEKNRHFDKITWFNVNNDIKNASVKDIDLKDKNRVEAIAWLKRFLIDYKKNPKQKGLYLNGNFGCGKTYLITAIFNELAKQGLKSAVVFWPEYLRDLKASFDTNYNQKYEYIKKIPLLLIDDIGAEATTAWSRDEILCPLLQYRMENHLPTFFTSNLDLKALEEHLSFSKNGVEVIKAGRIIERIKQLTEQLEMKSKNLRN